MKDVGSELRDVVVLPKMFTIAERTELLDRLPVVDPKNPYPDHWTPEQLKQGLKKFSHNDNDHKEISVI